MTAPRLHAVARDALFLAGPARPRLIAGLALRALEGALACGPAVLAVLAVVDLSSGVLDGARIVGYAAGCLLLVALQSATAFAAAKVTWAACYDTGAWLRAAGVRGLVGPWPGQRGLLAGDDAGTVLGSDTRVVENYLGWTLPELVRLTATPVTALVALFVVETVVAASLVVVLAAGVPVYRWAQARYARFATEHRDSRADLDKAVVEHVDGIEVIRAFGLVEQRGNALSRAVVAYRAVNTRILRRVVPAYAAFVLLVDLLVVAAMTGAAVVAVAGAPGADGARVAAALVLALRVAQPIGELAGRLDSLPRTAASVAWVRRFHDEHIAVPGPPLPDQSTEATEPTPEEAAAVAADGGLTVDGVSFSYGDGRPPALHDVSLTCPTGTLTVVVGPSGAGKTSLLHLAARLWRPTLGQVRTPATVAFVPQRPSLFSGSVLDNILAGRPDATFVQVEAAVRAAACQHIVADLPGGYDAEVGELGNRLSGGERQRVALARALLSDAALLLLDEPVAALDTGHEQQVIDTLTRLRDAGTTVVVVTHRLAIASRADHVVVVTDGRVTGTGTHDQVLGTSATYRALWTAHDRAGRWRLSKRG
ncbi:ATP-binding cassette subfamily B protein [Micromonospora sp. Llam0]|uniref:ABC transporter ATP-binding protein n=1 Tax=Micromonospora sp. Llam0 TaxID=2485143 RepID=UPI000FA9FAC0|nr:ATP-binding cassette domain-containing protein [Micromonospora sp. Llam0]ROO60503.1 ATP-binding cassette subfamily B protein [Micromonospora sp. Llam0]